MVTLLKLVAAACKDESNITVVEKGVSGKKMGKENTD